jgi:MFS family permease
MNEFANVMLPLIYSQQLHLAPAKQGLLAGTLGATQQVGALIFIMAAGALADIYGRRVMLLYTLAGFFLCLLAYPFTPAVWVLFALRFLWGAAFSGYNAGAPTIAMDIPDNRSRGKFNSIVLLVPWLAASGFVLAASRWPAGFRSLGASPHAALVATTLAFFKEPWKRPASASAAGVPARLKAIVSNIATVLDYAKQNKHFGVILFIGSVVRTDTVIIGSFLALWIVNAGRVGGIDAITAAKTAGLVASIRFVTKVVGAPLFGLITDKVNRTLLMLVALGLTTTAFASFGFVKSVFGAGMIVSAMLIGFAESAEAIASQSLIAQEAPAHLRGSSVGVFAFLGTASLMVVNLIGGYLFDKAGFSSPMLMEGVFHLLVLLIAIWMLRKGAAPAAKPR